MRVWILLFIVFSFLTGSAQYVKEMKRDTVPTVPKVAKRDTVPTAPVVPDSVMSYPDTLLIKIPRVLAPTFLNVLNESEYEINQGLYKDMMKIIGPQVKRQYVKKPTKK